MTGDDSESLPPYAPPKRAGRALRTLVVAVIAGGLAFFGTIAAYVSWNQRRVGLMNNEAKAIMQLKTLVPAQALFCEGDQDGDGVRDWGSFDQLVQHRLLPDTFRGARPEVGGYRFECHLENSARPANWWATAGPIEPGVTGERFFYIDERRQVYESSRPITSRIQADALPEGVQALRF